MKNFKLGLSLTSSVLMALSIAGCSQSDIADQTSKSNDLDKTLTSDNTGSSATLLSGKAIDGYLQYANVCIDLNNNSKCDDKEPLTLTDENGSYSLLSDLTDLSKYTILVEAVENVTIDSDHPDTKITKKFFLKAPADAPEVISPLTTLVQNKMDLNATLTKADVLKQLKTDLNISDSVNILDDYIAKKSSADANLSKVYEKLHSVAKIVTKTISDTIEENSHITEDNFAAATKVMLEEISTKVPEISVEVEKEDFNEDSYAVTIEVDTQKIEALQEEEKGTDSSAESATDTDTNTTEEPAADALYKIVETDMTGSWSEKIYYQYSSKGLLLKETRPLPDEPSAEGGSAADVTAYTYDAHGNLLKVVRTTPWEEEPMVSNFINQYNEEGILLQVIQPESTYFGDYNTTTTYNVKGQLIHTATKELIYTSDTGEQVVTDRNVTYSYNSDDKLLSKFTQYFTRTIATTVTNPDGTSYTTGGDIIPKTLFEEHLITATSQTINYYDDADKDGNGGTLNKKVVITYNEEGAVSSETTYDSDNNIIQYIIYTYDLVDKTLLEIVTLKSYTSGSQDKITTTFKYDTKGHLVETLSNTDEDSDGSIEYTEKITNIWQPVN